MGDILCKNRIVRCFSKDSLDYEVETESATVITGSCWVSPKRTNYTIYTPSPMMSPTNNR